MPTASKLSPSLTEFIQLQPVFFVATAASDGRVNVSPKGMDTLRVINQNTILWLNLTGSGNETAAHVRELSRMTLMFCAFDGSAKVVRTYGHASVLHPGEKNWGREIAHFDAFAGSRQIFRLNIDLVQVSCGTGVPQMKIERQRGPDELVPFWSDW